MRITIMRKISNQGLLSLIMVLVMIAPAQQPIPSSPPRQQVILAQRTQPRSPRAQTPAGVAFQVAASLPGQSATVLPDGTSFILGGTLVSNSVASARVGSTVLSSSLVHARAWHTSTVLPDGTVFIFGGLDGQTLVPESEIFSPATQAFSAVKSAGLAPRAFHTATLLTDGQVLIAGGTDGSGQPFGTLDLWDRKTKTAQRIPVQLVQPRRSHTATLQADGTVRIEGGVSADGSPATQIEVFDPNVLTLSTIEAAPPSPADLSLITSIPADGSKNVSLDSLIGLRFSRSLDAKSVNAATLSIRDQNGPLAAVAVSAESGMLAFVNVAGGLQSDSDYTVSVNGASDKNGFPLPPSAFSFSTESTKATDAPKSNTPADQEDPPVPPLQAGPGVTALSGIVRTVTGKYLSQVRLELNCGEEKSRRLQATSDGTGRFLIANTPSGHCKLEIDGTTVHRGSEVYGIFTPGVEIADKTTNVLPYTIWMTPLDMAHAVTIPSPTSSEFLATNPAIPGLELHLPPNATVKDYDGNVVTQLSITQIPIGRPPFPLPAGVAVPLYFTIQPGGAYIEVANGGPGARLFYPNQGRAPVGFPFNFWNYDPDNKGWYVYGTGKVDANRRNIVPNPGTVVYQFTGAMVATPDLGCKNSCPLPPPPCPPDCGPPLPGDPVDPSSGAFVHSKIDFSIPDVQPLVLTRHYHQGDLISRAFGIGTSHDYNIFLVGDHYPAPYTYVDLNLGDGSVVHFDRTSPHTQALALDYVDAIYESTANTVLYKAKIVWNGSGWTMTQKDGTTWKFLDGFGATSPALGGIISMIDRYGNTTTMTRAPTTGNLLKVISPNGRFIAFTYDSANRVTRATDNSGRHYDYTYDTGGRLATVTDPLNGVRQYTYDANNQMLTIQDPRQLTFVTNHYDTSGRIIQQDMVDGGIWHFTYTEDGNGNITQTDVTNPRGFIDRYTYNTNGYFSGGQITSVIKAYGQPEQQTTTYNRNFSGLLTGLVDPMSRAKTYTYDSLHNITGVSISDGTTTTAYSMTYDPAFNLIKTVTDPLNHTTTFGYDSLGKSLTSVTDQLQHSVNIVPNTDGRPASITNFAGSTQFAYLGPDLVTITDPTNGATRRTQDQVGRLIRVQAPLGQMMQIQYDGLNDVTAITDPLSGTTNLTYDGNGNLLTLQDANQHTTSYAPNNIDRVQSRQDALLNPETYLYDLNGNTSTFTDRKGQPTTYTYDALDRLKHVVFQDNSTIDYTYDAGNRLRQITDSVSGTITRDYDSLNRLTSEGTPQGSVSYTHDSAGRRATMQVPGQVIINYTWDDGNRLTQITQGTEVVTIGYDNANRRTSLTLPNGIVTTYGYDAASRLTNITYAQGSNTVGNLTYTYDANGQRTSIGGSLAQVNLPGAVASATYNVNNQLTQWGPATFSYDQNGNMISDGTNAFSWDARNQLSARNGNGYSYDSLGRRTQNGAGISFLYDRFNPVQELAGSTVTANLLTGLGADETFSRTDSAGSRSFLIDGLGSTRALTDAAGALQTQYSYEPFGNTTATGASSTNSLQYTGRENDGSGIYYYRSRYYNPTIGRFISEDQIGLGGGGTNFYAYAFNSPTNLTDPSGESSILTLPPGGPDPFTNFPPPLGGRYPPAPPPPPTPQRPKEPPKKTSRWLCFTGPEGLLETQNAMNGVMPPQSSDPLVPDRPGPGNVSHQTQRGTKVIVPIGDQNELAEGLAEIFTYLLNLPRCFVELE
jgi:RHS repeat-associated protein